MYDMLPYPNIVGATPEEQAAEITNYLIQLKETLEFLLMDISEDNLSQHLVDKLNSLGADIEKTNEDKDDQIAQVSNNALSLSDVINSPLFATSVSSEVLKKMNNVKFFVNFDTGNLEYITS